MEGLVMKSTGSWYHVYASDGQWYDARLRGKFKLKGEKGTNPITVGDRVTLKTDPGQPDHVVIEERLPRENFIIRKAVKSSAQKHIIAANIDQLMIMATIAFPKTSLGFIDRVLVSAESFRIPSVIVFNKQDLLDDKKGNEQEEVIRIYESIGFKCLTTSVTESRGLDAVETSLHNKVTLLTGHSGVGKSTLLNSLADHIEQKTREVSDWSLKGKHTTTFAQMFRLEPDTYVIDTPGIKEFGLIDIEGWELADYFPEMRNLKGECKYYNCTHIHEPGCAVKEAVKEGRVPVTRYDSYLSMMQDEDNRR